MRHPEDTRTLQRGEGSGVERFRSAATNLNDSFLALVILSMFVASAQKLVDGLDKTPTQV